MNRECQLDLVLSDEAEPHQRNMVEHMVICGVIKNILGYDHYVEKSGICESRCQGNHRIAMDIAATVIHSRLPTNPQALDEFVDKAAGFFGQEDMKKVLLLVARQGADEAIILSVAKKIGAI